MEPGTFKDRALIYGDPHQLIEGMLIAAYGMQMTKGFIFIRYEYRKGSDILDKAIAEAEAKGWLGKNIQGSGFDFHLRADDICRAPAGGLLGHLPRAGTDPDLTPELRPHPHLREPPRGTRRAGLLAIRE